MDALSGFWEGRIGDHAESGTGLQTSTLPFGGFENADYLYWDVRRRGLRTDTRMRVPRSTGDDCFMKRLLFSVGGGNICD